MQYDNSNDGATSSVISDSVTLDAIRRFIADESKPKQLQPIDQLLTIAMMVRKAEDHGITDSQQTLARKFGVSVATIARSQSRLSSASVDYVSRTRRRGRTSTLALNHESIPAEEALRLRVTPEAEQLALWYRITLHSRGRKRFPKHFVSGQKVSAQRILNACGGDLILAKRMIAHALDHPKHRSRAKHSLYNVFGRWKLIEATFAQSNKGSVVAPLILPPDEAQVAAPVTLKGSPPDAPVATGAPPPPAPSVASQAPITAHDSIQAAADLVERIKRSLSVGSPAVLNRWRATTLQLLASGKTKETIATVFEFAVKHMGKDTVLFEGAEGFERHFNEIQECIR